MDITNVKLDDGRKCAQLLQLLKKGRWDFSASDIQAYTETLQWVQTLAVKVAEQVKGRPAATDSPAPAVASSTQGFKIKGMGPLGGTASKPSRKSRKKK